MGGLFSKKSNKSRITEQDRAVLQLKQQRDKIKQYLKKINANLGREREVARKLLKDGKTEKAKLLLRKKRYQENLMEQATNQLNNIDHLICDIEAAQMQIEVMSSLQSGNQCLKQLHSLMSVEDVEKILDETKESVEYQQEIDRLVSGELSDADEVDILNELDQIIKESATEIPSLPDVPESDLSPERIAAKQQEKKIKSREQREAVLAS